MSLPSITANNLRRLRETAALASSAADAGAAAALIARSLTREFDIPVHVHQTTAGPTLAPRLGAERAADALILHVGRHGSSDWALSFRSVDSGHTRDRRLAVFARVVSSALEHATLRGAASRAETVVAATYSFARKLTRRPPSLPLRQFIVDEIAEATRARLASLAVHDEARGQLRVVATHGYPAVLVEHVRQSPGEGVLGRVFSSRRPMLVADLEHVPDLHRRRPRYRTSSFLSVPLLSNGDVLGIVSVADRTDDQPFDRNDLTAARALAAPAALALLNDRLSDQARVLAHAATVDPLTNLFNRRYFQTRLEEEMQRARRYALDLALLLIDVDDFKALNDMLGHLAGDHLLRQVADILKRSVRVFDVCTRFGGEEFAVLMPGSSVNNALVVAERIRSRIEGARSADSALVPPHMRITVSLGLAALGADSTPHELVARADRALYLAKAAGKNCVRMT